jgi:hypothetical protein
LPPLPTATQGILAPVAASIALFGSYLLIKYLPGVNLQVGRTC